MTATAILPPSPRKPLGWVAVGGLVAIAYVVLIGGTSFGEQYAVLRTLNAMVAGALLLRYVRRLPAFGDDTDRRLLLAIMLFAIAGIMSHSARQSFDAVLLAATYAAALFTARDLLARDPVRRAFIWLLIGVSLALTVASAAKWLPLVVGWWSASGRTVIPPLDLQLAASPWGHRYDLALLLAILYPAWLMGGRSSLRRVLPVVTGILVAVIVVVVGSRTLWAALGIATVLVMIPAVVTAWRRSTTVRTAILLGVLAAVAFMVVSGVASAIWQRASNSASLGWRTAMWGPLLDVWTAHPIAGYGPGSFPWVLQLTNYFDTNTWAPRHPDSVILQLLPEAGLLGILSLIVVVASVVPKVLRGRSAASRWVVLVVGVACIGANPTEFPFLMAVVVGWVAYAIPHESPPSVAGAREVRPIRVTSFVAVGVIALAYGATLVASFSYETARTAVADGDFAAARPAFDVAVALDPSMALYRRQRGELSYLEHDSRGAVTDLTAATRLNPSDDLAWRVLGLASSAAGDDHGAQAAFARALDVQRSDVTNLLLSARWLGRHDRPTEARAILGEIVQSWPAIIAAPGWNDLLPQEITTGQVIDEATRRWELELSTPELPSDQGLWLAALANRPDLDEVAIQRASMSPVLAQAELSLLRCEPAGDLLATATDGEKRGATYWNLRLWSAKLSHQADPAAAEILRIMSGNPAPAEAGPETLNPLDENGQLSTDVWGYRRFPIDWPDVGLELPSPQSGSNRWLIDARGAVRAAGLVDRMPACG